MADKARGEVEGDDALTALQRRLEYFPTPPWAARAGGELINAIDPPPASGKWWCWEPAAGGGHMVQGLGDYFQYVFATDIHDHGADLHRSLDFLSPEADAFDQVDWIVTNPPFAKAAEFVAAGLRRARRGVAILARTALLESGRRYPMFFPGADQPKGTAALYALAPFFERVPMTLGRWDPKASTATAYAWFVWMQPAAAADMSHRTRRLLGLRPEVWPIPPGTRERLTRPDDARLFGAKPDLAGDLFKGGLDG
ncbi:MAG: hypothetical protein ACK4F1_05765 [Phenylobacterium sp.]